MNLENISIILKNPEISDYQKINFMLQEIAEDEKAIEYVLVLLHKEREINKELITDQNAELSRALVVLKDSSVKHKKPIVDPQWVKEQIMNHYIKWQHKIKCCFQIEGLP